MLKKWRNNYWCGKSKNIKRGSHKWYFLNHKKINNNTWETYIIHYMYLFAKRLFFYYLWVMYTALNLRFREYKKKKNKVLLLLIIIIKNCWNLGALRRSFFFWSWRFDFDRRWAIGVGQQICGTFTGVIDLFLS